MPFSVNTNNGAFAALQNLNRTSTSLDVTQNRINTGLKVASAKDDASTYAIAQKLRGDLAGFNAVKNSLDRALSEIDLAIAASEATSDLLIQMRELAVAGSDEGLDASSREAMNNQFVEIRDQIQSIVENASFNGRNVLDGTNNIHALTNDTGETSINLDAKNLTLSALDLESTNMVTVPGASISGTVVALVSQTIDATDADFRDALINLENDNGGNLGGENLIYATGATTNNVGYPVSAEYANGVFAALGTAMGDHASSARIDGYTPFDITFTASSTIHLVRNGSASYLSVGDPSVGSGSAETTEASEDALSKIEDAISTVNTTLSELGSFSQRLELQQTFSSKLSDTLTGGIGNLVDADMAKESAMLQALQTKQQLGLQALSIANQAPQTVLSLFG